MTSKKEEDIAESIEATEKVDLDEVGKDVDEISVMVHSSEN